MKQFVAMATAVMLVATAGCGAPQRKAAVTTTVVVTEAPSSAPHTSGASTPPSSTAHNSTVANTPAAVSNSGGAVEDPLMQGPAHLQGATIVACLHQEQPGEYAPGMTELDDGRILWTAQCQMADDYPRDFAGEDYYSEEEVQQMIDDALDEATAEYEEELEEIREEYSDIADSMDDTM